jgi:hypothetical protein
MWRRRFVNSEGRRKMMRAEGGLVGYETSELDIELLELSDLDILRV